MDETTAIARLPNLDIEIRHWRTPSEAAEYLSISLRAAPSFKAMADYLDNVMPLLAWPLLGCWRRSSSRKRRGRHGSAPLPC